MWNKKKKKRKNQKDKKKVEKFLFFINFLSFKLNCKKIVILILKFFHLEFSHK